MIKHITLSQLELVCLALIFSFFIYKLDYVLKGFFHFAKYWNWFAQFYVCLFVTDDFKFSYMQIRSNWRCFINNSQSVFNHTKRRGKELRNRDKSHKSNIWIQEFKMENFLKQCDKEFMKVAMLKHEETFRQQVP